MEIKTENRVMKIQTTFSVMGPTIFELGFMKTELWVMETQNPNTPLVSLSTLIFDSQSHSLTKKDFPLKVSRNS